MKYTDIYQFRGVSNHRVKAFIIVENRKTFPLLVFCAPAEGVPLGIGYRRIGSNN